MAYKLKTNFCIIAIMMMLLLPNIVSIEHHPVIIKD